MRVRVNWVAMLLLTALTAYAEEAPVTPETPVGPATHAWLEMQRSGQAASQQPQPLSGPAMDKVHERYLKGFEHPLPVFFEYAEPIAR